MVCVLTKQNPLMKQTIAEMFPPTSVSFFKANNSLPTPETPKRCTEQLRVYGLWLHTGMRSRWISLDQSRTTHWYSKHDSKVRKHNHEWWRSFHCNCKLNSSACKRQMLWTLQALLSSSHLKNLLSSLYWMRVSLCHSRTTQHKSATD